jgi:subtilisin family serine protease
MIITIALLASSIVVAPLHAQHAPTNIPAHQSIAQRWIIRLQQPPLSQADIPGEYAIQSQQSAASDKLQLNTPAAQRYIEQLKQQQATVFQTIQQTYPAAQLHRTYQVVFNGLSVSLPGSGDTAREQLRALGGVADVYRDEPRELNMYSSIPLLNTQALWSNPAIGGQENAGAGIKIAVIDTGIKVDNPFFNPAGLAYPAGFPKGQAEHTTPKVIAARNYIRPDIPPSPGSETPQPGPLDSSHGTHVAGTAAGVSNTTATAHGVTQTISGVAPRAYLMNYKAFYHNDSVFADMAFDTELIAAIEDAVADGADVISNSWGGRANLDPHFDPIAIAANAAADAGVVVIFSVGNSGPSKSTADSGDFTNKLIMVGATTTDKTISAGFIDVTTPGTVPDTLTDLPYAGADFGPPIQGTAFGPAPYLPIETLGVSPLACDPLPPGALNGQIALVERGTCHFSMKVLHTQQAGAIATIVYNSEDGGEGLITMGAGDGAESVQIPSAFVQHQAGIAMIDWYAQHGAAALVQIDPQGRVIDSTPDVLAPFSSRGPTFQGSLKPDVMAPGVNILSAGFANAQGVEKHLGFGLVSGTSMAAPHVSGAAALLKQTHPDWTSLDIKSALMTTARTDIWLDTEQTQFASVLERGAGRMDLGRAASPGLLLNPPSLSFGRVTPVPDQPTSREIVVQAHNVAGAPQTYALSASMMNGNATVSVSPPSITPGANQVAQFTVTIQFPPGAAAGDYEGHVMLEGPQTLHMPFWARALPLEQGPQVLLLDNDGSSSIELHHYADYYYNALTEMGISLDYLDLDARALQNQTLPDISELQKYQLILWFTGDNLIHSGELGVPTPLTEADQNLLMAYLQSGGNLIATGQDLTEASDIESVPPGPHYGRSDLYHYYLGARFVQDNVFEGIPGVQREVVGIGDQPWLHNIILDLGMPGPDTGDHTSAGNQTSIDEITVMDADPRSTDDYTRPILRVSNPFDPGATNTIVGVNRFSDPTLEQPQPAFDYRTTYFSFGMEGIRNDTNTTTLKDMLWMLINWTIDAPVVELPGPVTTTNPNQVVELTAHAHTNTPATFVRYRWDFGDGTPIVETDQPVVSHQYAQPGEYHARVEAMDTWGHTAISSNVVPQPVPPGSVQQPTHSGSPAATLPDLTTSNPQQPDSSLAPSQAHMLQLPWWQGSTSEASGTR